MGQVEKQVDEEVAPAAEALAVVAAVEILADEEE